jgi:hypothetical protein
VSDTGPQNRYALAGGNPVSYVEWDGHDSWWYDPNINGGPSGGGNTTGGNTPPAETHDSAGPVSSTAGNGGGAGAAGATPGSSLPGSAWLHEVAVTMTVSEIARTYPGSDITTERCYNRVFFCSKAGNDGFTDITRWIKAGVDIIGAEVWEVKPDSPYGNREGPLALGRYVTNLSKKHGILARPGARLPPRTGPLVGGGNISVTSSLVPGLELYRAFRGMPAPVPEPRIAAQPESRPWFNFDAAWKGGLIVTGTAAVIILAPETGGQSLRLAPALAGL